MQKHIKLVDCDHKIAEIAGVDTWVVSEQAALSAETLQVARLLSEWPGLAAQWLQLGWEAVVTR